MTSDTSKQGLKVVGTRPIRPDGVEKVTGRANFGADRALPGMLHARIKRSPHAHARVVRINADKALALPDVRAVASSADFPEIRPEEAFVGEGPMNFRDLSRNVMARSTALYEGHAVAAVAAVSPAIAAEAVDLIEVEYEVLPHVIDVEEAMGPDAPVLHDDLFTAGVDPKPEKPSNIAKQITFSKGDIAAGFRQADVVIERRYTTKPVHQAYIEPHACVVSTMPDGQVQIWASSQGQFMIRAYCAKLLDIDMANIRVTPAEIGGGFGGKTLIYLEPVALVLSRKTGRPVKIVMTREEVFRATGPTSGGVIEVKLGAKRDGTIVAADLVLKYQAGAFAGSPVQPGCMCAFAMYDLPNVHITGYDVVSNRPKVAAYRAPGAPISSLGSRAASTSSPASSVWTHWRCARKTQQRKAPRRSMGQPGPISGISTHWRQPRFIQITGSPSAPIKAAASPAASGSMSAVNRARRCTSTKTARSASPRAVRISAAHAPQWR
jgi:CO/xanthine dehydrogenase Mo-binding subunit